MVACLEGPEKERVPSEWAIWPRLHLGAWQSRSGVPRVAFRPGPYWPCSVDGEDQAESALTSSLWGNCWIPALKQAQESTFRSFPAPSKAP